MTALPRMFLGLVAGVAALELASAAVAYRTRVQPEHWEEARRVVETLPEHEPIVVATPWLEPRVRMAIPAVARQALDARADLWGHARVHVLGLGPRLDGPPWVTDLEPGVVLDRSHHRLIGPLYLDTWELTPSREQLADLGGRDALEVTAGAATCRHRGPRWQCPQATVEARVLEIVGKPRRCLVVAAWGGATVQIRNEALSTGDLLRGHVGFGDFNGVLRDDAPAEVEILVDGEVRLRAIATDNEGWKALQIPTSPGTRDVAVRLTIADSASTTPRPLCLELRSFGRKEPNR